MESGTNEHPARLKVGIIGPGRAGTALARALVRGGHQVTAATAVSEASRQRVRDSFPAAVLTDPAGVLRAADLVLVTVPDDVLPGLIEGLAATGAPFAGRLVAHASGAHGIRVLDPATRAGALPLALHPVMTFTGREDDVDRIKGVSFGVTAPEPLRPAAEVLVIEMGGEPVFIAEENRATYHAALSFAANYLVTLVAQAEDLLRAAGADNPARCSARCSARPWTTHSGSATRASPARWRGATTAPWPRTSPRSRPAPPTRCPPTGRWPG